MHIVESANNMGFPPHNYAVHAKWIPLYIEPMVGSGERITIGVAVANNTDFVVMSVPSLERLQCVYGSESEALVYAASTALDSMETMLVTDGVSSLSNWKSPFEGVFSGRIREGAGESLESIAHMALSLCSSIVEIKSNDETVNEHQHSLSESRLEKMVRDVVISNRPGLDSAFGRSFKAQPRARSAKINFVGQNLAANFSLLIPNYLSRQVKDAKAKLWDLAQLQEYLDDSRFDLSNDLNRFELLVHRIRYDDPQYSDRQVEQIHEAIFELEAEADKKEIRCRDLQSAEEIANVIIQAEAA